MNTQMRTAISRLGFTAMAATAMVDKQGIDNIDELRRLKDNNVDKLCKTIRCPGGTIPNPNAGAAG